MSSEDYNVDSAVADLADAQDWLAKELSDPDNDHREKLAKAIILIGDAIDIIVDYDERSGSYGG
nr:MAG TPA: hypothetical protein [Caudoviricetes sp.]